MHDLLFVMSHGSLRCTLLKNRHPVCTKSTIPLLKQINVYKYFALYIARGPTHKLILISCMFTFAALSGIVRPGSHRSMRYSLYAIRFALCHRPDFLIPRYITWMSSVAESKSYSECFNVITAWGDCINLNFIRRVFSIIFVCIQYIGPIQKILSVAHYKVLWHVLVA